MECLNEEFWDHLTLAIVGTVVFALSQVRTIKPQIVEGYLPSFSPISRWCAESVTTKNVVNRRISHQWLQKKP